LLNTLVPDLGLVTGEISGALNRGRHTTRHVELVRVGGGLIADTPGFSTIEFTDIDKYNIKYCFPDFNEFSAYCKFRECSHINEPKCVLTVALHDVLPICICYKAYVDMLLASHLSRGVW